MNHADVIRTAQEGRTAGEIALGHAYLIGKDWDGNSIPVDYRLAKQWLKRAAEKGAGTALFLLGTMYEEGLGQPVDPNQAIVCFSLAAERGSFLACIHLARMYAQTGSADWSPSNARRWYRRALQIAEDDEVDLADEIAEANEYLEAAG